MVFVSFFNICINIFLWRGGIAFCAFDLQPRDLEFNSYFLTGVVKYGGSLVDISKLMQQLEKSDNTRSNTEEKLKELQKELSKCFLKLFKLDFFVH